MVRTLRSTLVALIVSLSVASAASAGTVSSTLSVRVTVVPACTVAGTTLDFGTYTSGQAADLNGFTEIAYSSCPAAQLRFQLDGGGNGTAVARKLANGSGGLLNYSVFRDSARTQNFGQGTDARTVVPAANGTGTISVYGRIPAGQAVAAGTYTDTVGVTVDF